MGSLMLAILVLLAIPKALKTLRFVKGISVCCGQITATFKIAVGGSVRVSQTREEKGFGEEIGNFASFFSFDPPI